MGRGRREKRDNVGGSGTERYAISARMSPKSYRGDIEKPVPDLPEGADVYYLGMPAPLNRGLFNWGPPDIGLRMSA